MQIRQALDHYGSGPALAKAIGVSRQVVEYWIKQDKIPAPRQHQIAAQSHGALMPDRRPWE